MALRRTFITTGSASSLRDVIDDVFASSSISEAGKNKIEAETTDFYKGVITNCSSQYSAEGVIEAANIIIASYLRNKYQIDNLDIPDASGSRIPTIGEINGIISGAFYREFSGSVDDWWSKKWSRVSGSVVLSGSFGDEWHKMFDPISGNLITSGGFEPYWRKQWEKESGSLITSGSFPGYWHGLYDPISGTLITSGGFRQAWGNEWEKQTGSLITSGNFGSRWHGLFDLISGNLITSGTGWGRGFGDEWGKRWNPISGALIVSGTPGFGHRFDDEWDKQWNPKSGSYILGSEFDTKWNVKWSGISGSYISGTDFDSRWTTKWSGVSGSFISRTDIDIKLSGSLDLVRLHVTNSMNIVSSSNAETIRRVNLTYSDISASNNAAIHRFEGFKNEVTASNNTSRVIFESASRAASASNAAAIRQFELVRDEVTSSNNEVVRQFGDFRNEVTASNAAAIRQFGVIRDSVTASNNEAIRQFGTMRNEVTASNLEARTQFNTFRNEVINDNATTRAYVTASNAAAITRINTVYQNVESNLSQSIAYVNTVVADVTGSQPTQMPNWQKIAGWIYNSGSAYLDIDFESSKGFRIECTVEWPSTAPAVNYLVARRRPDNSYIDGFMIKNNDSLQCQLGANPAILTADNEVAPDKRFNLEMSNISSNMYILIDKEKVAESSAEGSPENKGSVFIMATNCVENVSQITPGTFKLYYMKIYSTSDKLVANLWPAIDQKNGIPCMYDYVSGKYFYNKGTGNFAVSDKVRNAWN